MNKILSAAVLAASMAITSAASAAVVVFNAGTVLPSGAAPVGPVDVSAGSFVFADVPTLGPNDSIEYIFRAVGDIVISDIAMTGNGFTDGADLAKVFFGLDAMTTDTWDSISSSAGGVSTGNGFLTGGFTVLSGDTFSIFWDVGATALPVGLRANFRATDIPPIPLPAAFPLLAGGVALLGLVRRKGSKKSNA